MTPVARDTSPAELNPYWCARTPSTGNSCGTDIIAIFGEARERFPGAICYNWSTQIILALALKV